MVKLLILHDKTTNVSIIIETLWVTFFFHPTEEYLLILQDNINVWTERILVLKRNF